MNENVRKILSENNLDEYITLFEQNKLDSIETLSSVNESDYEKLGITKMGDRKKLLKLFCINTEQEKTLMESTQSPQSNEVIREKVIEKVVVEQNSGEKQHVVIEKKSNSGLWLFFTVVVAIIMIVVASAGG